MALPSGLPDAVNDAEVLARHVFNKHHQESDPKDHTIKWARSQAFLPLYDGREWLFSVSRTMYLQGGPAIQQNGIEVGKASERRLKGSALITARAVREVAMKDGANNTLQQLDVVADEKPDGSTPFHAHITGFLPLPEGADIKEFFKEASEDLARKARELAYIKRTLPFEEWENKAKG
jgi:hypothetical protein